MFIFIDATLKGYTFPSFMNIGWISANGNRIQDSLTLEQTQKLVGRIIKNYELLGIPLEAGTKEETKITEASEELPYRAARPAGMPFMIGETRTGPLSLDDPVPYIHSAQPRPFPRQSADPQLP